MPCHFRLGPRTCQEASDSVDENKGDVNPNIRDTQNMIQDFDLLNSHKSATFVPWTAPLLYTWSVGLSQTLVEVEKTRFQWFTSCKEGDTVPFLLEVGCLDGFLLEENIEWRKICSKALLKRESEKSTPRIVLAATASCPNDVTTFLWQYVSQHHLL